MAVLPDDVGYVPPHNAPNTLPNRDKGQDGFWARITGVDPNAPTHYSFEEQIRCFDPNEQAQTLMWFNHPWGERSAVENDTSAVYLYAIEVNGDAAVPVGSLVWMTPGIQYDIQTGNLTYPHCDYRFSYTTDIIPFELLGDVIPGLIEGSTGLTLAPNFTVKGKILGTTDDQAVDLYAAQTTAALQAFIDDDEDGGANANTLGTRIDLGVGLGLGSTGFKRTRGWCRRAAYYTLEENPVDPEDQNYKVWHDVYMIVKLDCTTLYQCQVVEDPIPDGDSGRASLWGVTAGSAIDTGYDVVLFNNTGSALAVGPQYTIFWSPTEHIWQAVMPPAPPTNVMFGKAQGDWTSTIHAGTGLVYVKLCDLDGLNVVGDQITVECYSSHNKTPAIYEDDVIAFQYDADGVAVCVSDCSDDPIGTIK
jgi:hypothetical protein